VTTEVVTPPGGVGPGAAKGRGEGQLSRAVAATRHFRPVLLLVVGLGIYFSATQPVFLTKLNIENLLSGVSVLWVVSLGMTFVLLTGGADLSVGATGAIAGILLAKLLGIGVPGLPSVLLAVLFGVLIGGIINGGLIGRLNLSFFVVTLASMTTLTGAVNLWSNTQSYFITSPLVNRIGTQDTLGLPTTIWIMIVSFVIALYVQHRTYWARDVYAIGGSIVAARLSGIRTSLTLVSVYALAGGCAALGGVITAGRIGAAAPQPDPTLPLLAIAAVLLGGTSLLGGQGGVGGTALGVLFIGILQNGLSLAGLSSFWQQVVTGVILVVAVGGDQLSLRGGVGGVRRRLGAPGGGAALPASGLDAAAGPAPGPGS
jgi:ribose/xylose/arabinose/galactoside ABC-type transport system permease subunit